MPAINRFRNAKFAPGTSLSAPIYLGAGTISGFQMPPAWDAANLTFQLSDDNVTYQNAYDSGGVEIVVNAVAGRFIPVDPSAFNGFLYVKLRSGTSGAPVNQTAARTVQVYNRVLGYAG